MINKKTNQDKKLKKTSTVGILIFDDVEVLDFAGPFEVFSVARPVGQNRDGKQLFNVFTIAENNTIIKTTGDLLVKPHFTISHHPPLDILIIPGGWGARREKDNQKLLDWITRQDKKTKITASVCTGAFLLENAGLLNGKKATTHWNSIEWMKINYPQITTKSSERYIRHVRK